MIEVRAAAVGDSTLYGRVTAVVRSAAEHRAPVESLAETAAKAIVVFAFVSSGATLALTGSATNAVSVLVVAGIYTYCLHLLLDVLLLITESSLKSSTLSDH
jgi:cation transport ATPase